jgi:hypothetical protein
MLQKANYNSLLYIVDIPLHLIQSKFTIHDTDIKQAIFRYQNDLLFVSLTSQDGSLLKVYRVESNENDLIYNIIILCALDIFGQTPMFCPDLYSQMGNFFRTILFQATILHSRALLTPAHTLPPMRFPKGINLS